MGYIKMVIIINGKGGVGKDTLINSLKHLYDTHTVSSIDPIKNVIEKLGIIINSKGLKERKLYYDIKKALIEYNDYPNYYILAEFINFVKNPIDILFIHIREKEEIKKVINCISCISNIPVYTLLIEGETKETEYNNLADDNVKEYKNYDFIYYNEYSNKLYQIEEKFINFFNDNIIHRYEEDIK